MLKNIFLWILQNIFKVNTQTTQKEIEENQKYAVEYERIDSINFNSIFSNKLANYVINDSIKLIHKFGMHRAVHPELLYIIGVEIPGAI